MKDIFDATFTTIHGDINRADAIELALVVRESKNILEFGIGGSSYIIHQNAPSDARIFHIETVEFWNEHVKEHLREIVPDEYNPTQDYAFQYLDVEDVIKAKTAGGKDPSFDSDVIDFVKSCDTIKGLSPYDFIFVDGVASLRYSFAMQTWDLLDVGGIMMFHDSKRQWTANFISKMIEHYYDEISNISISYLDSNMVTIKKCSKRPYYNWNDIEKENNRDNIALEGKMFV